MSHLEPEHQTPTNGTPPDAPDSQDDIDRLSQLGVRLTWEDRDPEDRLECCLANPHVEQWLDDWMLETFADFRPIRQQWVKIKAGYRRLGGDTRLLDEAVQRVVDERPKARPHAIRISARDLKAKVLPPLNYVVDDILPAGCTLLTGKSKDGKSLMAYNLAVAVLTGGKALGSYGVQQGSVWVLALEDGERRAQQRLRMQESHMGAIAPELQDKLIFTLWESPRLGEGLEDDLRDWILSTPDARLIIIDILEKVRPPRKVHGHLYTEDYNATASLTRLAQEHNVSILIVHHANKLNPSDFRDSASGAMSLIGGADNFWSLSRRPMSEEAALRITGRDIEEECELAMQFRDGFWAVIDDGGVSRMSKERKAIYDVLATSPTPLSSKQIAERLGRPYDHTRFLVHKMYHAGSLLQPSTGCYTIPRPANSANSANSANGANTANSGESHEVGHAESVSGVSGDTLTANGTQPLDSTEVTAKNGGTVSAVSAVSGVESVSPLASVPDCRPPPPVRQGCVFCHGTDFWMGSGGLPICTRCHPQPLNERKT
jgi:hypothetical protein